MAGKYRYDWVFDTARIFYLIGVLGLWVLGLTNISNDWKRIGWSILICFAILAGDNILRELRNK